MAVLLKKIQKNKGAHHICAPAAVAPTAPNNALSTATAIFTIVRQFFIIFYLLSSLLMFHFSLL